MLITCLYILSMYVWYTCVDACLHIYRYICVWKSELDIKSFLDCPPHTLYLLRQGVLLNWPFQLAWVTSLALCSCVYLSPPPV